MNDDEWKTRVSYCCLPLFSFCFAFNSTQYVCGVYDADAVGMMVISCYVDDTC